VAENVKFIYVRGVFKKRPNFLNSVPTSTEGALLLTMWSDGKQTVLPGSFSAFEGLCGQEEA